MDYEELREYIETHIVSPTSGRLKFRKVPEYIKQEIINHTLFYDYYGNTHMTVRCYFILDRRKELPICDHCGNYYSITTKNQYFNQNFCSRKCGNNNEKTRQKTINTHRERYGVDYCTQNKEVLEKQRKTNLEKYGVEHVLQKKDFSDKKKKTMLKRHGYITCFEDPEIQEKIKEKNLEKYGVEYPAQKHLPKETFDIINNKEKFAEFIKDKTSYEVSKELGILRNHFHTLTRRYDVQDLYKRTPRSYLEVEMEEFLDDLSIKYEVSNRTVLNGLELDFYIPEYNLAIEMNGIYWHSSKFVSDKNYHYNKWKKCDDSGIHLISIFEDDWVNQNTKVKNMIKTHLGLKVKGIPARKTYIQKIDAKSAKPFLEKYHLQGFTDGKHYGAFDKENNLIAVMTFGFTRSQRFELSRFVMDYYNHPGLFSKLFKYAQNDLNFKEVISFSDNSYFTGDVYNKNGFEFIQVINPDYRYFHNGRRTHKRNFTKDSIKKKFPEIANLVDSGITEFQIMDMLGIPRIYDCGKREWVWKSY